MCTKIANASPTFYNTLKRLLEALKSSIVKLYYQTANNKPNSEVVSKNNILKNYVYTKY